MDNGLWMQARALALCALAGVAACASAGSKDQLRSAQPDTDSSIESQRDVAIGLSQFGDVALEAGELP